MAEFVKVAEKEEVTPGAMKVVQVGGERVVVTNVNGELYAFADECTHDAGPLSEGDLDGDVVTCPWHFSKFSVRTGEVVESPADEPICVYELKVEDDGVYVGGEKRLSSEGG